MNRPQTSSPEHPLFGALNINKPAGMTSRDVVNVVQRLIRPVKCGHAGTLDPMATGVLPVCIGPATRLIELLQQGTKTYRAEFQLGVHSDTDDATGTIQPGPPPVVLPTDAEVIACLQRQVGTIQQTPPAYSAVHVGGERAYHRARRGEDVQLAPRPVHIERLTVLHYEWPYVHVEVVCGSGTYIRSIARDLGAALGCGGLMTALVRTAVGRFRLESAIELDGLTAATLREAVVPAVKLVEGCSQYACSEDDRTGLQRGQRIELHPEQWISTPDAKPAVSDQPRIALVDAASNQLLAMASLSPCGRFLLPRLVFCSPIQASS